MQNLSPRHVKTEESLRLGVVSGWYSTKVSGTFVSGPHDSEADCLRRIAEIDPPPVRPRRTFGCSASPTMGKAVHDTRAPGRRAIVVWRVGGNCGAFGLAPHRGRPRRREPSAPRSRSALAVERRRLA